MRIGFPVAKAEGLKSEVYGHFGSAPVFIIVETDNGNTISINNGDREHKHGACDPLKALNNQKVDAVIVGGIGAGALSRLNKSGIKVFHRRTTTAKETCWWQGKY